MKDTLTRTLARYRQQFAAFTPGQKVVAIIGTGALLLGGFMVYRWASTPSYTPLFSNLSASDASAITQELDSTGTPYQLTGGGNTIMVPQNMVDQARLDIAGQGLPSSSGGGATDPFAKSGIASSDFEQQTNVRMALESDLASTIEHLDGITTAVVHLAIPQKQAFSDQQDPVTASVLVQAEPGASLSAGDVQTIVQLVSSSVDGLDPAKVSVADSTGRVYTSTTGDGSGTDPMMQDQKVSAVQQDLQSRLQSQLDRIMGPGNSTVQVTPVLDFDKKVTDTTTYTQDPNNPISSQTITNETYKGPGAAGAAGGVVGPDGQMDTSLTGSGASSYVKKGETQDRAIGSVVERVESTPGQIETLHIGVALDTATTKGYSATDVRNLIASTAGVDLQRGDSIQVVSMPFDRSSEATAAAELKAATAQQATAARNDLIRKGALGGVVALMLLLALIKGRRRNKQRQQATSLVVEQLRENAASQQAALEANRALALEAPERTAEDDMIDELNSLIERQPEDVATLLRGWLTER